MHLPDGLLPPSICLGGYALTGIALSASLRIGAKGSYNRSETVPTIAVMTAMFFSLSLVHLPLPPSSIHLMATGLTGIVLGWYTLPAVLAGLFFQAVMFGHGGLTTLGVNTLVIGLPGLLSGLLFRFMTGRGDHIPGKAGIMTAGFVAGAFAPFTSSILLTILLMGILPITGVPTSVSGTTIWLPLAYLPLTVIEGIFTAATVWFLSRVHPSLIGLRINNA